MKFQLKRAVAAACLLTAPSLVLAEESAVSVFDSVIDDSHWSLLTRSVYERRDYLNGGKSNGGRNKTLAKSERSDYAEEWGLGLMGSFESGYTRGLLGFGVDAHAYVAQNLMGDDYRVGKIRLLPVDQDGYAQDGIARGGVALKAKLSNTVVRYGEQRVKTPVFSASDSRLLPETMHGWFINSKEFDALSLVGGHFTGSTDRNSRSTNNDLTVNYLNPATRRGDAFDLVGGTWTGVPRMSVSLFSGRLTDTWVTTYAGASYNVPLPNKASLALDAQVYHSRDTGNALAGDIDNTTASLMATYAASAHKIGLGWQKVASDTPFDYVTRGAIYLSNAAQLSDFNAPHETSWQLRYELDATALGVPGMSLGAAYVRGSGIDGTRMGADSGYAWLGYGKDGKHWERDLWVRYTVPSGTAKGTSVLLRYGVHRANAAQAELDADQIRLSVEFPMGG